MPSPRVLLTLGLTAFVVPAAGADRPLTWDDCVREARTNNPALEQSRLGLSAARDRLNSSVGGFLPRLSARVSTSDSGSARPYFDDVHFEHERYRASVSASQGLFSGFSTVADVQSRAAAARRAAAALDQAEAGLRLRLRNAFTAVLYLKEYVEVQRIIAERRKGNADLVRLRYEAGLEDRGAAMRAKADLLQEEFEVKTAARSLRLAQQKLARELGRDDFSPIEVEGSWEEPPPPADPDLAALASQTPAVAQAAASLDEARAGYRSAAASFWPSVDASASAGWGLTRREQLDGSFWNLDDMDESWSVSVGVSYLLFNWGQRWFSLRASRANLSRAERALEADKRDARVDLQQSLFDYANAHENVELRRLYLDASRARAEIARAQYTNGLIGFTQWDIIENELVQAERRYVAARRDAKYASANWKWTLGEGFSR